MLLAADIGNTSVSFGIFSGKSLLKKWKMRTDSLNYLGDLQKKLRRRSRRNIDGIIVSSVTPKALLKLDKALCGMFSLKPIVVGKGVTAPIKNLYKRPEKVGQDRLVNAVAAWHIYKKGAVIVDFGTAVTFDLVTDRGEYAGGIIVPGMEISLDNLSRRAALLPKISLRPPEQLLGRDTITSMRSGIFYGYGALCDGVVGKLKSKYGKNLNVIATGGHAKMISRFAESIDIVDEDLTLKGLEIIYRECVK